MQRVCTLTFIIENCRFIANALGEAGISKRSNHRPTRNYSHAVVYVEDLKVKNTSRSAKGTQAEPGKNVRAKAGLNRVILDQGWAEFRRQFVCVECGYREHADLVGAINALRAGHARIACEVSSAVMLPAAGTTLSNQTGSTPALNA
ncbi:MAG TPA: hypothetical protein VGR71_10645 [Nitrospira sp.]|nr:hypothetical protein [Nitrospira sp.]